MSDPLKQSALDYHEFPQPGKLGITITKPFDTPAQLSLAYTPGVAEPVPQEVLAAYGQKSLSFGPDYIIPSRSIPVCANVSLNRWHAPR